MDRSKDTQADVVADAQSLPFQNSCFHNVVSHHTVEHLREPELAVREMLRVTKGRVKIVCPHRFGHYAKIAYNHIQFFNKRWFSQLARKMRVKESVRTTFEPVLYFGAFGLLMRPSELIVEYRKAQKKSKRSLVDEDVESCYMSCSEVREDFTPQKVPNR